MRNGKEASAGFYEDKSTIGIEKIEIVEAYDLSNRIPGIQNPNVWKIANVDKIVLKIISKSLLTVKSIPGN